jgi:hypothetical protein
MKVTSTSGGCKVIHFAISLLTALAALSSGVAAWLWYRASQVFAPEMLDGWFSVGASRADPRRPNINIDATPIIEFAQESGRRNSAAARWSAAAAFFAFLAGVLGAYVHAPFTFP